MANPYIESNLRAKRGSVTATIKFDTRPITRALDRMPASIHAIAERVLKGSLRRMWRDLFVQKLAGSPPVKNEEFPRGGAYLGKRTGRGRRSVKTRTDVMRDKIIGRIGLQTGRQGEPDEYMAAHEEGFEGTVKVSAHTRRVASGKTVNVRAHERYMDMPARRYLRAALLEERPKIRQDLLRELERVRREARANSQR